jgi:hypothetical protein
MNSALIFGKVNLAPRLRSEEFGDSLFWIAFNDESLLLRPRFTLSALRLWLFGHLVLLSHPFLYGEKVPQPGIEPGRPVGSRECKSRLSTSSSTGACSRKALTVGAVMPLKTSPVPTFFGPISAALKPSSLRFSSKSLERNIFVRNRTGFAVPLVIHPSVLPHAFNFVVVVRETTENFVNRLHGSGQAGQIVISRMQRNANILRRHSFTRTTQNLANSVSEPQLEEVVVPARHSRQRCHVVEDFIKVRDLVSDFDQFRFEVGASSDGLVPFADNLGPRFGVVVFAFRFDV